MARGELGTKFDAFLRKHRKAITPTLLAEQSGYSRQHLHALRKGTAKPTLQAAANILLACEKLTGKRLDLGDLFDTAPLRRKAS